VTLAALSRHKQILAAEQPPDTSLGSLWAQAMDGMCDVPGCDAISSPEGVMYLTPAAEAPAPVEWPRCIAKSVIYSLTAWNPNGKAASDAFNQAASKRLARDIAAERLRPRAMWRSFGFSVGEGWREEGFSLAYDSAERFYGKKNVQKLAEQYKQAAYYAYHCKDGVLYREVVWCDPARQEANKEPAVPMELVHTVPTSQLAGRGAL